MTQPSLWPTFEKDEFFCTLGFDNGVVALVTGLSNHEGSEVLESEKEEAVARALAMSDEELDANDILQSYRDGVASTGRSVKRFPPSAESLHRGVRRTGRLPRISAAVDSYNVSALDHFVAFGVHDLDLLDGVISFRVSPGDEPFQAVGSPDRKSTQKGDYVYADANRALAWFDSKDSEEVKVQMGTRNVLVVLQGTRKTTLSHNQEAIRDACERMVRHCGGTYEVRRLWPE